MFRCANWGFSPFHTIWLTFRNGFENKLMSGTFKEIRNNLNNLDSIMKERIAEGVQEKTSIRGTWGDSLAKDNIRGE